MALRLSISVSLTPDMVQRLKSEAVRRDLSVSQLVRERIRAGDKKRC